MKPEENPEQSPYLKVIWSEDLIPSATLSLLCYVSYYTRRFGG